MSNPSDSSSASQPQPSNTLPVQSDAQALGLRVLYMVIFAVCFWLVSWILAVVAITQLILRLLNGKPHADLTRLGEGLASYAKQLIEFLTFASERLPFPFRPWPSAT